MSLFPPHLFISFSFFFSRANVWDNICCFFHTSLHSGVVSKFSACQVHSKEVLLLHPFLKYASDATCVGSGCLGIPRSVLPRFCSVLWSIWQLWCSLLKEHLRWVFCAEKLIFTFCFFGCYQIKINNIYIYIYVKIAQSKVRAHTCNYMDLTLKMLT